MKEFTARFILICFLLVSSGQASLVVVNSTTEVGPSTTIMNDVTNLLVPTFVDIDTYFFKVNDSATRSVVGFVSSADTTFGENRIFFRESEAPLVPDPALTRSGIAPTPSTMFIGTTNSEFYRDVTLSPTVTSGFMNGAQLGTDNWVYFSKNDTMGTEEPSFWVQLDLTTTTATPIRYVHDPADPYRDITLSEALAAIPEPTSVALLSLSGLFLYLRNRSRRQN